MSLGQSQDFTMEDLENFLNKESMSNIFNWLNDPKLSISGGVGGNIGGNGIKSKGNSIDFTNWNEEITILAIIIVLRNYFRI